MTLKQDIYFLQGYIHCHLRETVPCQPILMSNFYLPFPLVLPEPRGVHQQNWLGASLLISTLVYIQHLIPLHFQHLINWMIITISLATPVYPRPFEIIRTFCSLLLLDFLAKIQYFLKEFDRTLQFFMSAVFKSKPL